LDEQKLIKNIFTMKKIYILLLTLTISSWSFGQVINEVDADTPGSDAAEFIEIKHTPNTPLDGLVVVLFNGSDDKSYNDAIDLDGYSTDANGFFVIGSTDMGTPIEISPGSSGWLQNGPDCVALYQGDATDFPNDTDATQTNLIDAMCYDTNDGDDAALMTALGVTVQYNEDANGSKDTESNQMQVDGSFAALVTTINAENGEVSAITYTSVSDIATLRAGTAGSYYELTGEAIVSYVRSTRSQKYIQDASGGILIDDNPGSITSTYTIGDGMTGLKGKLNSYNGVKQFIPQEDPGSPTSTSNSITTTTTSIADLNTDHEPYESEVITLENVSISESDGSAVYASNNDYTVSDGTNSLILRTSFWEADYIGEVIPGGVITFNAIVSEFNGTAQIIPLPNQSQLLSTNEIFFNTFSIYPNPAKSGFVNITSTGSETLQATVFDILGKQVINAAVSNERLDVSTLNTGVYIVKLTQGAATTTKKLIIQ
jgi:hypothetical protein